METHRNRPLFRLFMSIAAESENNILITIENADNTTDIYVEPCCYMYSLSVRPCWAVIHEQAVITYNRHVNPLKASRSDLKLTERPRSRGSSAGNSEDDQEYGKKGSFHKLDTLNEIVVDKHVVTYINKGIY